MSAPLSDSAVSAPSAPPSWLVAQPFEARFLGGPCFRLTEVSQASEAGAWAAAAGARLVSCRLPATQAAGGAAALATAGFREIERLVTLSAPAGGEVPAGIRPVRPDEVAALADLGGRVFRDDRFHADPRIADAAADALKSAWVHNGLTGRARWPLVAVDAADRPVGFNLVMDGGDGAVIDLIAVAGEARGAGHGRRLVHGARAVAGAAGLSRVRVGTQRRNAASLALYAAAGFTQESEAATFHWCPEAST